MEQTLWVAEKLLDVVGIVFAIYLGVMLWQRMVHLWNQS
jgi:hypothetical protein